MSRILTCVLYDTISIFGWTLTSFPQIASFSNVDYFIFHSLAEFYFCERLLWEEIFSLKKKKNSLNSDSSLQNFSFSIWDIVSLKTSISDQLF